jgi:hypothetical protein
MDVTNLKRYSVIHLTINRRNNMCRLRLFYFENGEWGWAEWVIPYEEDIQAHIDFWSRGGKGRVALRMVTHEHIDLV